MAVAWESTLFKSLHIITFQSFLPVGRELFRSFWQLASLERVGENKGEAQEVYIRMGAAFFCFCFLVVVNGYEIVLRCQFCVLLLYPEVALYNVLNILIFLAYPENR